MWFGIVYVSGYLMATGTANADRPADPSSALLGLTAVRAAELPLALTLIPGILYLVLIRTWPGTIAAGAAFATVTLVLVSSAANDQSSMAGMVVIPLLASSTLAVVTAVLVESIRHPIEWLLPASPSPDCKQAFLIAYDSGTGLVQGAIARGPRTRSPTTTPSSSSTSLRPGCPTSTCR